MFDNIVPQATSEAGSTYELEVHLKLDETSVAMTLKVDDDGATLKTKKDEVHFPRSQWLDVAVVNNVFSLIVHGIGFTEWAKKRKFEKKNPGEEFTEFESAVQTYVLEFKPKKLPEGLTPASLNDQARRTYLLAYLDEVNDPTIIECEGCRSRLDVTSYSPEDRLFCENCSCVMGQEDAGDRGICSGCGYYTKLVEQEKAKSGDGQSVVTTSRTCHQCRVKNAFWAFVFGIGAAIGIGLLNVLTVVFLERFFPVLLLFAGLALLFGVYKMIMAIVYSMARKAGGQTPLENATNALRKGRTDEAMSIINSMEGDMTGNPGILLNLTRGLINAKDFEKAGKFADTLIAKFPNFLPGYHERVVVRTAEGAGEEEVNSLMEEAIAVAARNEIRSERRQKLLVDAPGA